MKSHTPLRLSEIKKFSISISYLLQIIPDLYTIVFSGSFNLLKKLMFKTEQGIGFISTLDAIMPINWNTKVNTTDN